jgi:glucose/arabinose dehydrogenase
MFDSLAKSKTVFVTALALFAGLLSVLVAGKPALGQVNFPTGFEQERVATGLQFPTAMELAPDGRLFVTEVGGTLRVIKNGQLLDTPFVNVSDYDRVDSEGGRGLLGVAFDPKFGDPNSPGNDYVYLHYTQKATNGAPSHNRVVRFRADPDNPDTALAGSEESVFDMDDLGSSTKHNGGAIHFGLDGKLYIPVGDNKRDRAAPLLNTQRLDNLFGKVLRINPDGTIPADNPYSNAPEVTGKNKAIWARGFRNPYTFAVQPGTGKIYVNDVGGQIWEEINKLMKKQNYGWPRYEGRDSNPRFEDPIFAYKHDKLPKTPPATSGCAITGGAFYNPEASSFPAGYVGDYFFADFCNGWIRRLDADGEGVSGFATGANQPVDLKVDEDGSLYYLSLGSDSVYKVQYVG